MNAFSNDPIKDSLCGGCDCSDFSASLAFVYDATAHTIVVTDNSAYPSADSRKNALLVVRDGNGKKVVGNISAADGDDAVTISTAGLDTSNGLSISATVVSEGGCISDGHISNIGIHISAGNLGSWDKDSTGNVAGIGGAESY